MLLAIEKPFDLLAGVVEAGGKMVSENKIYLCHNQFKSRKKFGIYCEYIWNKFCLSAPINPKSMTRRSLSYIKDNRNKPFHCIATYLYFYFFINCYK